MRKNNINAIRQELDGLKKLTTFSLILGGVSLVVGASALFILLG